MRQEILDFVALGPLPTEDASIDEFARAEASLHRLHGPISEDEAVLLAGSFGADDSFGLAWTLLHLIETAPCDAVLARLPDRDGLWIDRIRRRASNRPR